MDVVIVDTYEQMSAVAAGIIANLIRHQPDCVLGLATGSTPIGTYQEMVRLHKEQGLDFSKVTTFNLDEYLGISKDMTQSSDEDQSYARFMHEHLFKNIDICPRHTYVPNGLAADPDSHCLWYEDQIDAAGGIDIQLLGIGGDGHIAFNEPGTSLRSRTHVEALTQQTLDDNWEAFYQHAGVGREQMPQFAITMGVGSVLESRHALMIANGAKKAGVVAEMIEGPVTSQVTSSGLQLHPGKVTAILDKGAASKLKRADHYKHVQAQKEKYGYK